MKLLVTQKVSKSQNKISLFIQRSILRRGRGRRLCHLLALWVIKVNILKSARNVGRRWKFYNSAICWQCNNTADLIFLSKFDRNARNASFVDMRNVGVSAYGGRKKKSVSERDVKETKLIGYSELIHSSHFRWEIGWFSGSSERETHQQLAPPPSGAPIPAVHSDNASQEIKKSATGREFIRFFADFPNNYRMF